MSCKSAVMVVLSLMLLAVPSSMSTNKVMSVPILRLLCSECHAAKSVIGFEAVKCESLC